MEDDLNILKVEYLSNQLLDHIQISNLSLDDQTIFYKFLKWRRPPMEDNFKILKGEYHSNHLDKTNLSLDDSIKFYKFVKWRWTPVQWLPQSL